MNFILGADRGGSIDDFCESVTLFEYKDVDDLIDQIEDEGYDISCFRFYKPKTIEQAGRHVGFFNEWIKDPETGVEDLDSWRYSVDKPMLKYKDKDVIWEKDFTIKVEDLRPRELSDDELDKLEEQE